MAPPLVLLTLASALAAASAGNIPEYIHVCKKGNPDIIKCIIDSIESLRPKMIQGMPELGVPGIEPLILPEIVVSQGGEGSRFRAVGHDVKVYGPASFKIIKLEADIDNHVFKVEIELPVLYFEAVYDIDAKLLNVPLKGKGPLHANATDCKAVVNLKGQLVKKNGDAYLYFYNIDISIDVKDVKIHLEGLDNGNKAIAEATNRVLNENHEEFWPHVKPIAEETIGKMMLGMANNITSHFTYNELFPE